MVEGIGPELGFQSHTGASAVVDSALARFVQEVARIELNAGTVGVDGHGTAGGGVLQNGTGIAEYFPVVVEASLQVQRFIILPDVPGNGLGAAEIHGGAGHTSQLTGGNILLVIRAEETAGEGQQLFHGGIGFFVASQIEIAVVGQIEDGVPVGQGFIEDMQSAGIIQRIGDLDDGIAGEALVAMGAVQLQSHGGFVAADHIPQPLEIKVGAGVKVVFSFIGGQMVFRAADDEGGILQPVGAAAHGGTQSGAVCSAVAIGIVIAQHHICQAAGSIRYQQPDQGSAIIGDGSGQSAPGYGIQSSLAAVGQCAEIFLHGNFLLHFCGENRQNYVKNSFPNYITIQP